MLDALALIVPVLLVSLLLLKPLDALLQPLRGLVAVGLALVVVLPAGWGLIKANNVQLLGEVVSRVETNERVVALTFDDGPTPEAAQEVALVLRERQVRATFFLNGREVEAHPDVARALVDDGHELGNHSWSHPRMVFRSTSFVREELSSTDRALRQAGEQGPIHVRAPYGKKLLALPWVLDEQERTHVTWDVAPDSKGSPSTEAIVAETLARVKPGSIVLLHAMYPSRENSRRALPALVDALIERGYRFVTVSELLALRGG